MTKRRLKPEAVAALMDIATTLAVAKMHAQVAGAFVTFGKIDEALQSLREETEAIVGGAK